MGQKFRAEPPLGRRQRIIFLGDDTSSPSSQWASIGRLAEIGPTKDVHLDLSQEHVLAIVGKRGSGKSFTLGSFLEGLCTHKPQTPINQISKDRAALLFDTLNIFQWMVAPVKDRGSDSRHLQDQARLLRAWGLEPVELDVDLWVPAGFEGRVTAAARPFTIRTWDMELSDWAELLRVDAVREQMGQLLSQVLDKVTKRGWTAMDGSHRNPVSQYSIADLLRCLEEDQAITHDYSPETVRAVTQRLRSYESSPLFADSGPSLTDLLRPGRLSVMLLSGITDDIRLVVIYLTIRKLLFARAQASEATKTAQLGFANDPAERARIDMILEQAPPKTWVVIDEAQNVFPSERQTSATDILLRFVREGRNFGLSLGFTTQQPSAIDSRIMAQVDTLVVHTLTVQRDLQNVLSNQKSRSPDRVQLRGVPLTLPDAIRQLDVGQAFVSNTDVERSFFMDIRPRVSIHGGFES
jgi:energy-coupling factor transporter ATP-binding protein EcfA2